MQIDIKKIKNSFEKSMDKYDENAFVQKIMAQKLAAKIAQTKTEFEKVLELGTGTGLLTSELIQKISYRNYCANDLTEKSKKYLDKILPQYTFIKGNAKKIKISSKVDLIVSNAMFQWFNEIDPSYYSNLLNKDGIFAFTTFSKANFCEIKDLSGISLNYCSLEDLIEILGRNFEILNTEEFEHKLNFKNPLELLAHLKNTGVNSLTKNWTFKDIKDFCERYKEKYQDISLTYAPIVIVAKKIK